MRLGTPSLDFVVIGAQKAGTTSLWRYLEDNPALCMPPDKEASFFCEADAPDRVREHMRALFKSAPRGARLGTVTPAYMHGAPGASVELIARRIRATFPDALLVALLRDPVARARSAHAMMTRRGVETRTFAAAVDDLLSPSALRRARQEPRDTATYVVAGEYGRMLQTYLELFPRDQLHVELTADLDATPGAVVERVCAFLGVPAHASPHLGRRFFAGGPPRVDRDAEADLKAYLERHVWPRVRYAEQHREAFANWFELWNVQPQPPEEPADDDAPPRLRAHFAQDAGLLESALGLRVPWSTGTPAEGRG